MSIKSRLICAATAALSIMASAAAHAQDDALPEYMLSMTLYDGATVVGKPAIQVQAWAASHFDIAETNGARYRASFSVEPRDGARILFVSRFEVSTPSGVMTRAEPIVEFDPGKPAFILIGNDAGDAKQFRAEMTIRPVGAR